MMFFNEDAREAAACRIGPWTNQWRDPENGPFDGDESDYLRALADVILNAALEALPERSKAILALAALSEGELMERATSGVRTHWQQTDRRGYPPAFSELAAAVLTALGLPVAEQEPTGGEG